jgi:hypothetical protein
MPGVTVVEAALPGTFTRAHNFHATIYDRTRAY